MEELSLAGRVALVTGACGGLGQAYVTAILGAGGSVMATDVAARELADLRVRLSGDAADRLMVATKDLADPDAAEELVAATVGHFGRLDGLVNNAAAYYEQPVLNEDVADMRRLMTINAIGPMALGLEAARAMLSTGGGSIVNVVSGAAQGIQSMATYGASKGALLSATYSWALDLAGLGVRVNALSPRANTPMSMTTAGARQFTAQGRTPDKVAPAVVYLLSDASASLTGATLRFDGEELALLTLPRIEGTARREHWSPGEIGEHLASLPAEVVAPASMARMLERLA